MGKPSANSRPLRIANTVSRLVSEGQRASFIGIQNILLDDKINPVSITVHDWNKFIKEIGFAYFYDTDGTLSWHANVSPADFRELVTSLNRSTEPRGLQKYGVRDGIMHASTKRRGRR